MYIARYAVQFMRDKYVQFTVYIFFQILCKYVQFTVVSLSSIYVYIVFCSKKKLGMKGLYTLLICIFKNHTYPIRR